MQQQKFEKKNFNFGFSYILLERKGNSNSKDFENPCMIFQKI